MWYQSKSLYIATSQLRAEVTLTVTKTNSPFDRDILQALHCLLPWYLHDIWQRHWQKKLEAFSPIVILNTRSHHEFKRYTESFHPRRHINSLVLHLTFISSWLGSTHSSVRLMGCLVFIAVYPSTSNGTNNWSLVLSPVHSRTVCCRGR